MLRMERVIYIIPTPIGNMEDITLRSIRALNESDMILAEDTRVSKKILKHYNIKTKLSPYHSFNEHKIIESLIEKIGVGLKISLICDAGTPGISDPGYLLIRECIRRNINVICLPGATACIPAIIKSGLSCEKFTFEGFIPTKKKRKKTLEYISQNRNTTIIYESPHRIIKTLHNLYEYCGNRKIAVIKEISKLHEKAYRGAISEVILKIEKSVIKGEFIIVLDGKR